MQILEDVYDYDRFDSTDAPLLIVHGTGIWPQIIPMPRVEDLTIAMVFKMTSSHYLMLGMEHGIWVWRWNEAHWTVLWIGTLSWPFLCLYYWATGFDSGGVNGVVHSSSKVRASGIRNPKPYFTVSYTLLCWKLIVFSFRKSFPFGENQGSNYIEIVSPIVFTLYVSFNNSSRGIPKK